MSDIHTGQSGLPLDPNGLFFDKRWAGGAYASTQDPNSVVQTENTLYNHDSHTALYDPYYHVTQDPNGDFHVRIVRVPAYSGIGESLSSTNTDPTYNANIAYNNQLSSGVSYNELATNFPVKHRRDPADTTTIPVGVDDVTSDDINPAAQNVAWIYAGSDAGTLYAYTPSIPTQTSGFGGGISEGYTPRDREPEIMPVRRSIFSRNRSSRSFRITGRGVTGAAATALLDPDKSVAALGGKNLYEWGETAYIVVYDISLGDAAPPVGDQFFRVRLRNRRFVANPSQVTIQVKITDKRNGGITVYQTTARCTAAAY